MTDRFDAALARLRASGEAYAVATVVRTLDATSAKPGAKALVLADGTIAEGWVGGGCARGAVGRAAVACIRSGVPQLLSLRPADLLDAEGLPPDDERDGARFAASHCPSRGSMDIFIEPVLPRPRLVILGAGPVALALSDLAGRFDLHRVMAAPGLQDDMADTVVDGFEAALAGPPAAFVVVATQGRGDEAALRAAIASQAGHVAFVGSRRKFATLSDRLSADGLPADALARVRAPAGLDIDAITPEEIALSILAEITQQRRRGDRGSRDRPTDDADRGARGSAPPVAVAVAVAGAAADVGAVAGSPVTGAESSIISRLVALFAPAGPKQAEIIASLRFPCC